jgi:hypothetical protein
MHLHPEAAAKTCFVMMINIFIWSKCIIGHHPHYLHHHQHDAFFPASFFPRSILIAPVVVLSNLNCIEY